MTIDMTIRITAEAEDGEPTGVFRNYVLDLHHRHRRGYVGRGSRMNVLQGGQS